MLDEFLLRALAAGVGIAVMAGPLGCILVWRRMAYFGDAMAHTGLLGVALGLILGLSPLWGVLTVCAVAGLLLLTLRNRGRLTSDSLLAILAHGGLAFGLIVVGLTGRQSVNLSAWLFGDILAVGWGDVAWIYGGGVIVLGLLVVIWRPLVALSVHEDVARAEGVPAARIQILFMLLMAVVTALAIQLVGVLLMTSLLIVPAATARRITHTPESMAVGACLIGALAVGSGLGGSLIWDLPSGPAIVAAAIGLFALLHLPFGKKV